MSVARVTEIIAASPAGLQDAIERGVERATETLDQIEGVWVQDIKATIRDGRIHEWRVNLKVTFVLKS